MQRELLLTYLDQTLMPAQFRDYAPNGLQVEGRTQIERLAVAVSASAYAIDQAIAFGADALLVHHGYFWRGEAPEIIGMKRQRLAKLLAHDINLLAYHLPLDAHPQLGNNIELARRWNIESPQALSTMNATQKDSLLWLGNYSGTLADLLTRIEHNLGRTPQVLGAECIEQLSSVGKIAWCSGAAQDFLLAAKAAGANLYISGEVSERTYYEAVENNVCYIAVGHYASEMFGVQAVAAELQQRFQLSTQFIFEPNPV